MLVQIAHASQKTLNVATGSRSGTQHSLSYLLEDSEITRVPGLRDDEIFVANLAKDGVVDVLEIWQSQILFGHDRRNQTILFKDEDRSAFAFVWSIESGNNSIFPQVVDVARQRAQGHFERRQVLPVAGKAVNFGIRSVCNINPLRARPYCNSMPSAELARARASTPKREVVPGGLERVQTKHAGSQDEIKI